MQITGHQSIGTIPWDSGTYPSWRAKEKNKRQGLEDEMLEKQLKEGQATKAEMERNESEKEDDLAVTGKKSFNKQEVGLISESENYALILTW